MSGLIDPFLTVSQLSISVTFQETSRKCPPTWDGWQCWPHGGSPGQIEFRPCPSYIYFHSERNQNVDPCGSKYLYSYRKWTLVIDFNSANSFSSNSSVPNRQAHKMRNRPKIFLDLKE